MVVNRESPSLHEGSLKITLSFPLWKIEFSIGDIYIINKNGS